MNWTILGKWYYDYFSILIITLVSSPLVSSFIEFDADSLLWMASTVAQAFGALIAIVIALGLFEKERITKKVDKHIAVTKSVTRRIINGRTFKEAIKTLDEQSNLWPRLIYPLQSMVVLIAVSLLTIMLAKNPVIMNDYVKCFFFIFLFLLSVYTLEVLLIEIRKTFIPEKDK